MNLIDSGNQFLTSAERALASGDGASKSSVAAQIDSFLSSHEMEFRDSNVAWMRDQLNAAIDQLGGSNGLYNGRLPEQSSTIGSFFGGFAKSIADDIEAGKQKVGGLVSGDNLKLIAIAVAVVGAAYIVGKFK